MTISSDVTTIRVTSSLRDRLKAQARAQGTTLVGHLAHLAEEEERRMRLAQMRVDIANNPPDNAYLNDFEEWQSDAWS